MKAMTKTLTKVYCSSMEKCIVNQITQREASHMGNIYAINGKVKVKEDHQDQRHGGYQ